MKQVFRFKKGYVFDMDDPIFNFIYDALLGDDVIEPGAFPVVEKDIKITINLEYKNKKVSK